MIKLSRIAQEIKDRKKENEIEKFHYKQKTKEEEKVRFQYP